MRVRYTLRTLLIASTLIAFYLSAYCGLLKPDLLVSTSAGGVYSGSREPNFRYGGRFSKVAFFPASSIDHLIRPNHWTHFSSAQLGRTLERESIDYSWGHVEFVDGSATTLSLYASTEEDVQAALLMLRDLRTISALRVNGDKFHDRHLQSLFGVRNLNSLRLLSTRVTPGVVDEFRRGQPNLHLFCVATAQGGM